DRDLPAGRRVLRAAAAPAGCAAAAGQRGALPGLRLPARCQPAGVRAPGDRRRRRPPAERGRRAAYPRRRPACPAPPGRAGRHPGLRSTLLAPLAERPADRPETLELPAWVERLAMLVRTAGLPAQGVDWSEPESAPSTGAARAVGRASVAGTETDAFKRIERLERELVELRGAFSGDRAGAGGPLLATAAYVAHPLPGLATP